MGGEAEPRPALSAAYVPADDDELLLFELGGKHRAQALSTAAALGVADRLRASGARGEPLESLAAALGCDPDDLQSLLRCLCGMGYLDEPATGRFALTTRGEALCSDRLGAFAAFQGSPSQWDAWSRLRVAMRDGGSHGTTPYQRAAGHGLYEHLAQSPDEAKAYDAAIDAFSRMEAAALVRGAELAGARRLVDVGGGRGALLRELLRQLPDAEGVLFDLSHVIARVDVAELADGGRARCESGDFFAAVPAGGDVYLLKHVLHNWDDERAAQLLRRCREAMSPGGRVLAIDALLWPDNRPDLARMMDLEMRVLCGSRERRKPEVRRLFHQAGLELAELRQLTPMSWLFVGRPVQA
ncbi:MAG: methyltransferase domain-containing protein [Planctomycetes bacterium]|nr:methyltransferase domain-containing protein [Planctomycetota bacterium]